MRSPETEYTAALEAMRTSVRCNTYHNPMAMSQVLPALNKKSYLTIKHKQCLSEDGMWPSYISLLWSCWAMSVCLNVIVRVYVQTLWCWSKDPVMELETKPTVNLTVEVVTFSSKTVPYNVAVPKGSTLLKALGILRDQTDGFT